MATLEIASSAEQATPAKLRQIVLASVLGTAVEWYDFLIYGVGAALVFNKLFFPTFDPLVGTLAAFGSYAVGFVARPLGGAIFGHFGDRLGRKAMLTMTMVIMGGGTFLIGLLPTYSQIGILAPTSLIFLRLLQGIGIGGEWGGAVLMVIESGDAKRRGFLGSLVQVGFPLGMVLATIVFAAVSKLSEADFLAWGWRIPFLVSVLLVGVGLFVRLKLVETPKFQQVRERNDIARLPIVEVLLKDRKNFLIAVGLKVTEVAWVYILTVFIVFYASSRLALPRAVMLDAVLYAALLEMLTIPLFGLLSDRIGRKPLYMAGAIFSALFAFPLFFLLETRDTTIITLTIALAMSLSHGMMFGPQAAFLPEHFGTKVRYSGASLGCQVSAAISGGFAPLIATALLAWENGTHSISLYMVCLSAITLVAVIAAKETAFREL
jgi:MFS transporter, MHS family, shikimate and dehydroshikimate transport protein